MNTTHVKVPATLLLDRHLGASAKLIWIVLQLRIGMDPFSATNSGAISTPATGLLVAVSGLNRHTVLRGLSQLESAEWLSGSAKLVTQPRRGGLALVPVDLLLDRRVGIREKLLHGALQLTHGFRRSAGQFSYLELSSLAGVSLNTSKSAIQTLQETGWLQISQRNRLSPIHFTLRNPAAVRKDGAVIEVRRRLEEASFIGEALMREYLTLIVDSDEYDDNASPGFLVNPFTSEEMQFDRYYPPSVAFEFNGPQHYSPTERYPNEVDVRKQQARDYIKMGICVTRGLKLVVLHPEDLSLEVMRQKVDGLLPLRNLDGHEPVIPYLAAVSRVYRKRARQSKWREKAAKIPPVG